jgi:NAD(P)-dependent dehydrogenase (short-subunit alcohol dehydrogenase family)
VKNFEGTVAVVTGAGAGLGLGIALTLAKRGASVVVADISLDRASEAAELIGHATAAEVLGVQTDVSDPKQVDDLAVAALERFGAVDILCNNAGTATVGYSWEAPLSDWDFVFGVNFMGAVHGIRSFVPHMLAGGRPGHIVNTSSMAGLIAVPLKAPYTASKHAVVGLSKTLRGELQSISAPIGVSVVCPGPIATTMIDDEIARYRAAGPLDAASQQVLDGLKAVVDQGISREQAGEIVVAAIADDRFWVFPNSTDYFAPFDADYAELMSSK